ncbi:MAG TPA: Gfo/Idh/MocA family oxidoreductase [Vicinamibacterales bacterium]|nr:Gfo/Idh/MocA family oxidoreductase [Vicinamibacterales bacterium]
MARPINVALIGYAFMGKAHSNAYRQVTPFMSPRLEPRMKVLCGRTQSRVQAAALQYGWEEAATDWREVVARKDIDLVDISTPGDLHAEIAIEAARHGKAVLCEKPHANSVAEAQAMVDAVDAAGVAHMICHNYRRIPAVVLAKQLIEAGRIGTIRHFRGTYLQDWIADPEFPLGWRLDKTQAGSGALGDIGAHVVDLARYLVGEITEVSGHLETFVKERPLPDGKAGRGTVTVDDAAMALARFENGAIGTIEGTRMAAGRKNSNRFEINGSTGSIAFDLERMNELEVYLEAEDVSVRGFHRVLATEPQHPFVKSWWPPGHIIGYEHTFVHTVYDLLEAIADKRLPSPNFHDGLRNQKVLAAIENSSTERRWVSV